LSLLRKLRNEIFWYLTEQPEDCAVKRRKTSFLSFLASVLKSVCKAGSWHAHA